MGWTVEPGWKERVSNPHLLRKFAERVGVPELNEVEPEDELYHPLQADHWKNIVCMANPKLLNLSIGDVSMVLLGIDLAAAFSAGVVIGEVDVPDRAGMEADNRKLAEECLSDPYYRTELDGPFLDAINKHDVWEKMDEAWERCPNDPVLEEVETNYLFKELSIDISAGKLAGHPLAVDAEKDGSIIEQLVDISVIANDHELAIPHGCLTYKDKCYKSVFTGTRACPMPNGGWMHVKDDGLRALGFEDGWETAQANGATNEDGGDAGRRNAFELVCPGCGLTKAKQQFSKKQWKKKGRCTACVDTSA